jgi:glycosyltransferase involved in cell wall biosynthesis
MRIAQVSPLMESVPPKAYGGTERVVSYLTEELVKAGEEVTLFASGDSRTKARLIPCCDKALRIDGSVLPLAHHVAQVDQVFRRADEFDIIHFHIDYLHYPIARRHRVRTLTTLHNRQDIPDLDALVEPFADLPLVSISQSQRKQRPEQNWVATIHHGQPEDLYPFNPEPEDYLAFVGRIAPEKRVDRAIEIARAVNMKLRIAAKVDAADQAYFDAVIKPMLDRPNIEFIGEINDLQKRDFLGKARAMLFPIDWPEPFGLVMIVSFSCGTPVVAFKCGSVPEVMVDGVTGYVVQSLDEAIEATRNAIHLDRQACRKIFEERYTARRMAAEYLRLYCRITGRDEC